jgi:hypothetical protein
MTATEKIAKANHWRIGPWDATAGWNGVFIVPVDGELWHVILADSGGWRHLAVTNFNNNHTASYNVIRTLRDYFYGDEAWVVHYYPPFDARIGTSGTVHLWESIDAQMPVPVEKA